MKGRTSRVLTRPGTLCVLVCLCACVRAVRWGVGGGEMQEARNYVSLLIPPVLSCFTDPDSRVRYYACEALYNIAKVVRAGLLSEFNPIFDGLCKVCCLATAS